MVISDKGLKLIKSFEGCGLKAYKCPAGVWTIGYGHTGPDVVEGRTITQADADKLLVKDLTRYMLRVDKYMPVYKFNQNQYDALVSFCYNLGSIDTLVLNGKMPLQDIPVHMQYYCYAKGKKLKGLEKRRKYEAELFNATPTLKSVEEVAGEVLAGQWGNGAVRTAKLEKAGYNAKEVQARVNTLLKG